MQQLVLMWDEIFIKGIRDPGRRGSIQQSQSLPIVDATNRFRHCSGETFGHYKSLALQQAQPSQDLSLRLFRDRAGIRMKIQKNNLNQPTSFIAFRNNITRSDDAVNHFSDRHLNG